MFSFFKKKPKIKKVEPNPCEHIIKALESLDKLFKLQMEILEAHQEHINKMVEIFNETWSEAWSEPKPIKKSEINWKSEGF